MRQQSSCENLEKEDFGTKKTLVLNKKNEKEGEF